MHCRICGSLLEPDPALAGKVATSFKTCMYRCEACCVGYSNARDPAHRRSLFEHPSGNVPTQLAAGLEATLRGSFNERARPSKWARFGSSSSEDAVTWSVLRFLEQTGQLNRLIAPFGHEALAVGKPTLLLWGYPVAGPLGSSLSAHLASVCDALGERPAGRSEPDIIVAWPRLLVFAEAKTGSPNEILRGDARDKIDRYTADRADILRASSDAVRDAGYYELVRNWRIAADLADRAGISSRLLINLGPATLNRDVIVLKELLALGDRARLEHLQWAEVIDGMDLPDWFRSYAASRALAKM